MTLKYFVQDIFISHITKPHWPFLFKRAHETDCKRIKENLFVVGGD